MAMTAAVKDELSRVNITRAPARRAEIATLLRFAGALHLVAGHIVIEAELDTGSVARRLRKEIAEVFGHSAEIQVVTGGSLRKGTRYLIRVSKDGEGLARQTGLVDGNRRPVRGLPPQVVSGAVCDAAAAWRGAFLAHGSLTEPGRSSSPSLRFRPAASATARLSLHGSCLARASAAAMGASTSRAPVRSA